MSMTTNPYLSFPKNNAREAMEFYGKVFHATPTFQPLTGMPGMEDRPDLIMHSTLEAEEITLMAADNCGNQNLTQGDCVTIAFMADADSRDRAVEIFNGLSEGGTVHMPLEDQPWGDTYGEFVDKFGVPWAFNIAH